MHMPNSNMWSTAVAALMVLPIATGAAVAQEQSQQADQNEQTEQTQQAEQSSQQQTSSSPASGSEQSAHATGEQQDSVVATVGDAEIRGSDVMTVIGMLPPEVQSQPPEMLVPMALEQLILRELILEDARSQNLADDPEVIALVENSAQTAEEDAMVQVWLDREMANVVTDEAVQKVYTDAQAQEQEDLPPMNALRPQLEQHLRQQAMGDIRARLMEGADIVLYDPSGRPIEEGMTSQGQSQQQSDAGTASSSTDEQGDGGTGSAAAGGNTSIGQSGEQQAGSNSDGASEQTQDN